MVSVKNIIKTVGEHYGFSEQEMTCKNKRQKLSDARQVAMYLANKMTRFSYPVLGKLFKRDHTTVIYAVNKIKRNETLLKKAEFFTEFLNSSPKSIE
jgi:chromosomal replication initiator protein